MTYYILISLSVDRLKIVIGSKSRELCEIITAGDVISDGVSSKLRSVLSTVKSGDNHLVKVYSKTTTLNILSYVLFNKEKKLAELVKLATNSKLGLSVAKFGIVKLDLDCVEIGGDSSTIPESLDDMIALDASCPSTGRVNYDLGYRIIDRHCSALGCKLKHHRQSTLSTLSQGFTYPIPDGLSSLFTHPVLLNLLFDTSKHTFSIERVRGNLRVVRPSALSDTINIVFNASTPFEMTLTKGSPYAIDTDRAKVLRNIDDHSLTDSTESLCQLLHTRDSIQHVVSFKVGLGGITQYNLPCGLYTRSQSHSLIHIDVVNFYTNIMLKYRLHPLHIPADVWFSGLQEVLSAVYSIGTKHSKVALQALYGMMLSPNSKLYSPVVGSSIAITGQFLMLSLIDRLMISVGADNHTTKGMLDFLVTNTDGIIMRVRNDLISNFTHCIDDWCNASGMVVTTQYYDRLLVKANNSYITKHGNTIVGKGVYRRHDRATLIQQLK